MANRRFCNLRIILSLAYNYSKVLTALPVSFIGEHGGLFHTSKKLTMFVGIALLGEGAFIYRSFVHSVFCYETVDCAKSYVTVIEACYSFTLILVSLFCSPRTAKIFNVYWSTLNFTYTGPTKFFVVFLAKCLSLYVFIAVEIARKTATEDLGSSAGEIAITIVWFYTKNVAYSYDCLLLVFLLALELNFRTLNIRLSLVRSASRIHLLLNEHWHLVTILKETSEILGPLFLVAIVYKQLLIVGMVYFTLLATLPDDGDDILQIQDIVLPTITLAMICAQVSTVVSECYRFSSLLQHHITRSAVERNPKATSGLIRRYPQLLNCRKIEITASGFMIIRAGLIIKIGAVASTTIIAIKQLAPLPTNVTITD